MIQITSRQNPQFRMWKTLLGARGINKENCFLFSGRMALEELQKSKLNILAELIEPKIAPQTIGTPVYELARELFIEVDELGTNHSVFVVEVPEWREWDSSQKPAGLEIFAPLGDPQNLGALFRSAEAFGASKIVLLEESAHPFLPKTLKASAGSCLRVPIMTGPALKDLAGEFLALDMTGTPLGEFSWPKNCRLLLGEEGQGLASLNKTARLKKICIETKSVESLNVTVAASLALYQFANSRVK